MLSQRIRAREKELGLDSDSEDERPAPRSSSRSLKLGDLDSAPTGLLMPMPDFSVIRPPDWVPPSGWASHASVARAENVAGFRWKRKRENGSSQRKRRKAKAKQMAVGEAGIGLKADEVRR
jgi:hypothetical protein